MLNNLQGARAFAAICVVIFHFGLMPATALAFRNGAFGVDIFFVLSGFIIAFSSARRSKHFLAHRLIRVLPPYWIATLIAALLPFLAMDSRVVVDWLVQSLFFLPGPDGRPALIFVGWTLVYELAFYLIYWVSLRIGGRQAPIACMGFLLVLALVPLPFGFGPWPLLIEFALGIAIYLATERLAPLRSLPGLAGVGMALLGVALLFVPISLKGYDPDDHQSVTRVLIWGLPSAATVFGLVVAERGGIAIRSRFILLLGAASYAIYLLHPIVLGPIVALPANPAPLSWLYCLIACAVTIGLSILFYRYVEAPLLKAMRRLLDDRPSVVQQATIGEGEGGVP